MHYLIIVVVISIIVYYQLKFYIDTKEKLNDFESIFLENSKDYCLLSESKIKQIENSGHEDLAKMLTDAGYDSSKYFFTLYSANEGEIPGFKKDEARKTLINYYKNEIQINYSNQNLIFSEIIRSINDYLSVNKSGVSDFHLMKDIVDRNCDAQEEEINTQIPIPLYLGLVGTMVGILIGIGYLWVSGGLNDLLSTSNGNSGAKGVEALLGGVALAMIASIMGILLTTFGSINAKNTKAIVEKNKHTFLSWIQAKLLPNLSNDTASSLQKMAQNLVSFNKTFATNTSELGNVLSQVNESYRLQAQLLNEVRQIADKDVSTHNLQLYKVLKESSKEIEILASYLNNVNDYLSNVKALNDKLDASEQRTKSVEDMATFFREEIQQVEARKGAINKAVGKVDDVLHEALSKLKDHANDQLEELKKTTIKQYDFLQQQSEQVNALVSELKSLKSVKESISRFEQATNYQNSKMDNLVNAIHALAKAKAEGTSIPTSIDPQMPKRKRIILLTSSLFGGSLIILFITANWVYFQDFFSSLLSLFKV